MVYRNVQELPREKLLELIEIYAKNWYAMDGVWFQAVEGKYGIAEALEHDIEAWRRFTVIEARRIKGLLQLPERPGLAGLAQALAFRRASIFNEYEIIEEADSVIYRIVTCRVQAARERKNMAYHTCKPVAEVEYSLFAKTIDDRLEAQILSCHPDVTDTTCHCSCRFVLKGE